MNFCFLCHQPTERIRSLTQVNANPSTPLDAVPICQDCTPDWNFSLMEILRSDISHLNQQPVVITPFTRLSNPKF